MGPTHLLALGLAALCAKRCACYSIAQQILGIVPVLMGRRQYCQDGGLEDDLKGRLAEHAVGSLHGLNEQMLILSGKQKQPSFQLISLRLASNGAVSSAEKFTST